MRYFLEFLAELLDRMTARFQAGKGQLLEERLVAEAEELRQGIAEWTRRDFLKEVEPMTVFPASSQVLQRRSGYRELLEHYLALILAARYPISGADLARLMEAKEASKLYEYWTFFELADLLRAIVGEPLEAQRIVSTTDYAACVPENQIRIRYPGDVELAYNRSYPGNLGGSYSVTLRPDVTLDVGEVRHFFDAKFRVARTSAPESSPEEAEEASVEVLLPKGWFKADDIRKMHAYREAIRGVGRDAKPVASVWVLYPGTEFRFFDERFGRADELPPDAMPRGIGAIPLAPGEGEQLLEQVVHTLVKSRPATSS